MLERMIRLTRLHISTKSYVLILLHAGAGNCTRKKPSVAQNLEGSVLVQLPGLAQCGSGAEQGSEREVVGCVLGSGTASGSRTSFLAAHNPYGAAHPVAAALQFQCEN